jgi:ABC-2 type transport system permease protein
MPEASAQAQVIAPATIPASGPFYWSVRRELWEYRSIYIAPLAVAALFLFGFMISMVRVPAKMRAAMALSPAQQQDLIKQPYEFAAMLVMGITFVIGFFYCLDALHGERRDRSILFWKSLPVSDLTAVLSKACIPLVVLPLVTFVVTVATQLIMLLIHSAVFAGSGLSLAPLAQLPLLSMGLLYHLVTVHSLYYAPIFGWLLLVSAWARRAPVLWAALPPLAIGFVEKIAFNTTHFAAMLGSRISGGPGAAPYPMAGDVATHSMTHLCAGCFFSSPGLWIGLAVAAIFLAAAVRVRRYQGPI